MEQVTRASGVVVQVPEGLAVTDATPRPAGRRRGGAPRRAIVDAPPPRHDGDELSAVVAGLEADDMTVLDIIPLGTTVERTAPTGRRRRGAAPPPAAPGDTALTVPLEPGEDAVVLVEQDGLYTWHFPDPAPTPAGTAAHRRRGGAAVSRPAGRAVFTIPLAATQTPAARRRRGGWKKLLLGPVRAIVVKFAARATLKAAIRFQERNVRPGLVAMDGPDPTAWTDLERLDATSLPADRPARILLWCHGTFSSTRGSFGALGATDAGRALLTRANAHYDAVIGIDHPTLSATPAQNVDDLLTRLPLGELAHPPEIDAIAFSRGALVLRTLVEQVLPQRHPAVRVRRAAFVAPANGGTQLAEEANWKDLLDLLTNLGMAGARLAGLIPGAQLGAVIAREVIAGLGDFATALATEGLTPKGVPGLYAMAPTGDIVAALQALQPGQPLPGEAEYLVVRSNFEPGRETGDELPARLKLMAADAAVDGLMKGVENDLVVDLDSMVAIDPEHGDYISAVHDIGTSQTVYHTVYFAQDDVAARLMAWFGLIALHSAPPPPAGDWGPADAVTGGGGTGVAELAVEETSGGAMPVRRMRSARSARRSAAGARTERVPAPAAAPPKTHVMAQMPPAVAVDQVATVEVQVARKALRAAAGTTHAGGAADADPGTPLIVQVIPKANLELVGEGRAEVTVPAVGADPPTLYFDVRGTDAGPGELWVVARQGSVPLMSLTLAPEVTASAAEAAATPVRARAQAADPEPDTGWEPMLAITEEERGGDRVYRFTLQAPELGAYDTFTSERITGDRAAYVAGLYRRIEERWLSSGDDERAFAQELRAFGYELLMELFPAELRAWLWKHRKGLRGVMVTSTEPFIPWELVHLAAPTGRGLPRETAFLGQAGLVRWRYGGWPATELRLRRGRVRHIVPDYPTDELALTEILREAEFLTDTLGSAAVPPDSNSVRALLARGSRMDLIHFAGHGEADGADIGGAALLLEGRIEDGAYIEDRLLSSTVRAHARLAGRAGGPMVVLNACQVGRQGPTLTGVGGFADAFLEAGARVFVSSLWSVGDVQAHSFAQTLYTRLLAGDGLAQATTAARAAARKRGDAAWLAYVVYGHPDARIAEEDRAALAAPGAEAPTG